jgi:N utilization substance protein B
MQTLFEWDFRDQQYTDPELKSALERNAHEFAPGIDDYSYMYNLLDGVVDKQDELNDVITNAAPHWPLEKIATVDRNILRLGLYELLYADREEVPPKVAIDEAIELAKGYGGESSGSFVNGVIGAVYEEIGEPGKDQTSDNKIKDIPYEEMPIEKLGGAVVFAVDDNGSVQLALVHDVFGHWTLPKGHIENDDMKAGIKDKVAEETGLQITLEKSLGDNEYVAADPDKGKIRKQVQYYLGYADHQPLTLPEDKGGLDDIAWFSLPDIVDLNFYDDIMPIITSAVEQLVAASENANTVEQIVAELEDSENSENE